ncbi:MAG: sulfite exporter TauE/SafE family protein [Dactylosporangium sp.]|nr:sulfite exporter TauE/SafE family protein [Dactylosporangium sp.]NNJ62316.1 sulfite exporter TauE/SafE family protein [Dactylosporangium sp.]
MNIALTLVAAVVVGLVVGTLGGGGSILTVPLLLYVAQIPPRQAIAMSLFIVGTTCLAGLATHAHAGRVRWKTGAMFASGGMVGAYLGGRGAEYLPAALLLIGFGTMMAATAVAMLRPGTGRSAEPAGTRDGAAPGARRATAGRRLGVILAQGTAVGSVTGLVGAGGGFIVVPALVLLGGLGMAEAVGTSLLVIAAQAFAGFAGHLHGVALPWPMTIAVTAVAVVSAVGGARLAGGIDERRLRQGFGWLVATMAVVVLAGQAYSLA